MPIVNTKNNNKHNVVKNITPATSAKASIEFNFPWNVLVNSTFSSFGYFTSTPLALFSLKDIDLNIVSYIVDHKNSSDTAEYFLDDQGIQYQFIKIGVQDLDMTTISGHELFVQRLITVINNTSNTSTLNLTASLGSNNNTIIISHTNSELGASSNTHEIFNDFDSTFDLQTFLGINTNATINQVQSTGSDQIVNLTFDYLQPEKKSGALTIDPVLKIKNFSDRYNLPKKLTFSKKKREDLKSTFNDNNTILYDTENISAVTGLQSDSSLSNLLISSPNTFDLNDFLVSKNIIKSQIDYYLKDSQEKINESDAFNENTSFYENKESEFKNEEEIEIDLNFNIPCILSNNRNISPYNLNTPEKYELTMSDFTFPVKVENSVIKEKINVKRYTSPTSYFNFSNNRWDYLGDIKRPTYIEDSETYSSYTANSSYEGFEPQFDSYDGFTNISNQNDKTDSFLINNSICFSGVTNDYSMNTFKANSTFSGPSFNDIVNKHFGSIGVPIGNFGFPYSEKFQSLDEHLISLKEYIHKDFYLKKVVFDTVCTSFIPGQAELDSEEITAGNFDVNEWYRIKSLGNTDFTLIGAPSNTVNVTFIATGPGTGTGTAQELSGSGDRIGVNNISFFLLNNRKNLNNSYFSNIEHQQNKSVTWDYSNLDENNDPINLKIEDFPRGTSNSGLEFNLFDSNGSIRKFSYFDENNSLVETEELEGVKTNKIIYSSVLLQNEQTASSESVQRELITYNNIVNFCQGSVSESSIYSCVDKEKAKKEADFFMETSPYHTNGFNSIENKKDNSSSYYKENITIESNVKAGTMQLNSTLYSHFPTLLSNKHGKRTLYEYNSGRSNKHEIYTSSLDEGITSSVRLNSLMSQNTPANETDLVINTTNYKDSFREDEYVLKPEDNITLGVSLTNSFNNFEGKNGNLGDDVFIIHSLKLKLIGSYKRNEYKKTFGNIKNKNINVKRSIIGDNDVLDHNLNTPIQLNQNYFTRKYDSHGINSLYTNKNNIIDAVIKDFVVLESEDSDLHDSCMNSVVDVFEVDGKAPVNQTHFQNYLNLSEFGNFEGYLALQKSNYENPTVYDNNINVSSYPFEDKYANLNRPIIVNYSRLGIKGIVDQPVEETSTSLVYQNILSEKVDLNLNKYFYSFNRENTATRVISEKISGYRLGVLFHNRIKSQSKYSNRKYGNFSDKLNFNLNFTTINKEGDITYTVTKKFSKNYVPLTDTSLLENTYNKGYHSQITKPFIDKDLNSLTEENSIP